MAEPLLEIRDLRVSYGGIQAVKGIDLYVGEGELVALIGNTLKYDLISEGAVLGAEEAFQSFAFTGTAPFILEADDADPAVAATLIIEAGGAQS